MFSCRAGFFLGLAVALVGGRGFAEDPPGSPLSAAELRLKEVFSDGFQNDTREKFEIKGDVAWEQGLLTLSEKSSIGARIESGPWGEWQFDLDWPALEQDGDEAVTLLRLKLEGANEASVSWIWTRQNGQTTGRVQILDSEVSLFLTKTRVVREFPVATGVVPWKVRYRQGLITVENGKGWVGADYLKNGVAFPTSWTLVSEKRSVRLQRVHVGASPPLHVPTADEARALAKSMALYRTAAALEKQGKFAQAEPLFLQSNEVCKQILGEVHPEYAIRLHNLAGMYSAARDYAQAEKLYLQSLDIRKRVLGEDHPGYAVCLTGLASMYVSMEAYPKAEPLYVQARDIRKKALGEEHPDHLVSLFYLGEFYRTTGKYAQAEPYYIETRDIRKRLHGEEHADYAQSLNSLARLYQSMGAYTKAEPLFIQSRDIRKRVLGESHPQYAESLNYLGLLYSSMGDDVKAEPLYVQARDIRKRVLGTEHPHYADSLNNLATLYWTQGEYAKAEPLYIQSRDITKRTRGPESTDYAMSLSNLALLYSSMGEPALAEPLLVQARGIFKKVLTEEHPDYAVALNNLAELYRTMGEYAKAEPLYVQSCDIRKRLLGEAHPDYAVSLSNLAMLYSSMQEYAKAEPLYIQARGIWKQALGTDHPKYAAIVNNLAAHYRTTREFEKSEPLHVEARDIRRRTLGERHPDCAASLNNLAELYHAMGRYSEAEALQEQATDLYKQALGEDHPHYASSLHNLAAVKVSLGRHVDAEPLYQASLQTKLRNTRRIVSGLSEVRSQEFVSANLVGLAGLLFSCRNIDGYPSEKAYNAVWQTQGIVSQTLRQRRRVLGDDPEARKVFNQLRATQQQLARWTLMTAEPGQQARRQQRLQELDDQKEQLETELARTSAAFRQSADLEQRNPDDLMRAAPDGTAIVHLLKIAVGLQAAAAKGDPQWAEHYEAFVLTKSSPGQGAQPDAAGYAVAWVHLGPAQPIDSALTQWREQIQKLGGRGVGGVTGTPGAAAASPAEILRKEVWQKIEPKLAGCKNVIVIPDGDLHFLPWGALPGNKPGTYLVEEYAIATAQDGRQLYQTLTAPPLTGEQTLLLVGGVAYDQGEVRPIAPPLVKKLSANEPNDSTRSLPPALSKRPVWSSLAGTAVETEQLTKLAGVRKTKMLRGSEAQENTLRQEMPHARFIHLATHGFFADETFRSAFQQDEAGEQLFGGTQNLVTKKRAGVTYRNPLLLSGIVLAGANQPPQVDTLGLETGQDGILTAEEVVNLDLQQTELVVLSACETGLGRVGGGEGVFGLQRAFALAGVRTTVASLWKVDDMATQTLMTEFYRNLWEKKLPKLEALRQAQLTMLRRYEPQTKQLLGLNPEAKPLPESPELKGDRLAPYYWAAFTLSGDWR